MASNELREGLNRAVMTTIQPQTRPEIPALLDALGIPDSPDDPELSKRQYIDSRLRLIEDRELIAIVGAFLAEHGQSLLTGRFDLEELLWSSTSPIVIPRRMRYELVRALERVPLYIKPAPFLELVRRLWLRETAFDAFVRNARSPLLAEVERHLVRNPDDWTVEEFFERLGAFDVSDRRFTLFLEGLAFPDVRPDEASQREFADAVNTALSGTGVEFREVDTDGGFPVFRFAAVGQSSGRPKNLIFASRAKPDIRFHDAINNDIEIVSGADDVLVYDRSFPAEGLRWRDLQKWWAEAHGLDDEEAKRNLYRRLLSSLPEGSPPQKLFFESFFKSFSAHIPGLPALLPEVWLHWDPKTVRERGPDALIRFRMDFLMLFSHEVRVVIEVDGKRHYSNDSGRADSGVYANMVKADRDLRLAGYDVYRFGAAELDKDRGPERVREFFASLFKRYRVVV